MYLLADKICLQTAEEVEVLQKACQAYMDDNADEVENDILESFLESLDRVREEGNFSL